MESVQFAASNFSVKFERTFGVCLVKDAAGKNDLQTQFSAIPPHPYRALCALPLWNLWGTLRK